MGKQFLYVSLGILFLAIAYGVIAGSARADWNPSASGCIVGFFNANEVGSTYGVFSDSGECWLFRPLGGTWERSPMYDLPLPVSEISLLGCDLLVTHSDDVWRYDTTSLEWTPASPFPGCPSSAAEVTTWGRIKAKYAP